jgi:hypothetical protein
MVAVLATPAPLIILAVAWDLSRFLVITNLSAMLAVGYLAVPQPEPAESQLILQRPLSAALAVLIIFYTVSPAIYVYFNVGTAFYSPWSVIKSRRILNLNNLALASMVKPQEAKPAARKHKDSKP